MRRLLTILPMSVLMLLVAVPAFAAEEAAEEFSGSFTGLAYAAVVGIVLGIVYFAVMQGDDHAERSGGDS